MNTIELHSKAAILAANKAMDNNEKIELFGTKFMVSSLEARYIRNSDKVSATVELKEIIAPY